MMELRRNIKRKGKKKRNKFWALEPKVNVEILVRCMHVWKSMYISYRKIDPLHVAGSVNRFDWDWPGNIMWTRTRNTCTTVRYHMWGLLKIGLLLDEIHQFVCAWMCLTWRCRFDQALCFFYSYSFSLLILDVSLFSYVQHAWQRIHCLFYYSHTHTHGPLADPWIGSIVVNLKRITALALPYPCHIISQAHRRNCH